MFDIFTTVFKYKEKSSPDKLGIYPERVHVKAMPERRYLWSSRVLVIIAIFSICFNMMLASTIYLLIPMRNAAPRLLYLNSKFNQMKMLEPSEISIPTFDLVTEQQVRDYIMYRYLISSRFDELSKRWGPGGPVFWMSGSRVYQDFKSREAQQGINLLRLKGIQRDVEIDWITAIARSVWQVQFRTLDYAPNTSQPDVTIWRATMRVGYASINYPDKNYAMRNPFGFVVKTYSLAYHGKATASSHYLDEVKKTTRKKIYQ